MLSARTQHAKSEKAGWWPSEPLDTLIGCVLAVWPVVLAVCLANQRGVWEGRNALCALFFYALRYVISSFHVALPTSCISRKRRMYTLLWSWQHIEAVCSMQLFCLWGQMRANGVLVIKAAGCWFESGRCVGGFNSPVTSINIKQAWALCMYVWAREREREREKERDNILDVSSVELTARLEQNSGGTVPWDLTQASNHGVVLDRAALWGSKFGGCVTMTTPNDLFSRGACVCVCRRRKPPCRDTIVTILSLGSWWTNSGLITFFWSIFQIEIWLFVLWHSSISLKLLMSKRKANSS